MLVKPHDNVLKVAASVRRILEEIEGNCSISNEERKHLLDTALNEIIENDPIYGDLLIIIKRMYDKQECVKCCLAKAELAACKKNAKKFTEDFNAKYEKLKSRNKALETESKNQAEYNKKFISDLMNEINNLRSEKEKASATLYAVTTLRS